jgi:membrane associated rhomboid family serine protease/cbb3-type cytochrome oxidase subunit 3
MLIIPYQTRFTARSLPLVTLVLIVVNAIVYFAFQAGDRKAYERAAEYYFSSDLPTIELPRYAAYLEKRSDRDSMRVLRGIRAGLKPEEAWPVIARMQNDRDFMRDLQAGAVISSSDAEYVRWREQRARFDTLFGQVFIERFALSPDANPLRLLTYQFLHGDAMHWFGNMIVLLLAGPFAEAALGRFKFLLGYLATGAAAGALHLLASDTALVGASGSISGAMAMVAVLYGTRKVPVFYWLFVYFNTARVPALALLPVWLAIEAVQWAFSSGSRIAYSAHIGGFLAGALIAWLLAPRDSQKVDRILDEQFADERKTHRQSSLQQEAQQAAARLDTRRAARAYGELLAEDPGNTQYATAYFNMALLGRDRETLIDAALRVLWIRTRGARAELRTVYLQMSQPHVLSVLPVDEQLRLARRLVSTREDAAALRVLDGLLGNDTLKNLYSRQLADCLLGLFTTYARHGLRHQADDIKQRLSLHFPSPASLGGIAPNREPPMTIRGTTRSRSATIDPPSELDLDLDTRLQTRWGSE